MTTPYRNEIDALRERKESLEREIGRLREQTTELEGLRSRQEELARELAGVEARLRAGAASRRTLPMLDQVRVASPCHASWDEMLGDDRVRFCLSCEKNVYNLSAMTRDEAEALLSERTAGELCVRFHKRADGTVMTQDCPVGARRKRRKKLALAVAGAGAMAAAAATMFMKTTCKGGDVVQGEMAYVEMGDVAPPPPVMGTAMPPDPEPPTAQPPPTAEPAAPPPQPHVMGRLARPPRKGQER